MNMNDLKRAIGAFVAACSLLSGVLFVSVSTGQAQGKRGGGGESRGSGSSQSSSGGNHSRDGGGRSSSSSGGSSHSRGGGESRSRGSGDGGRHRDRSSDSSTRTSSSGSQTLTHHHDRDVDGDRDHDRGRHREHRHRRDRDNDRDDRYRAHHNTRVYQSSNYGGYGYSSNAYDRGYQDGLYTGANDARRGQGYEPERSHFYRHGAGGFFSVFGNRGTYQQAYRDGFLRGYEEGYQHYETYFSGGRFHR